MRRSYKILFFERSEKIFQKIPPPSDPHKTKPIIPAMIFIKERIMSKNKNIKQEINDYRLIYEVDKEVLCTKEENKVFKDLLKQGQSLPEGVFPYEYDSGILSDSEFYRVVRSDLTQEEIMEYLAYKKLDLLNTIKNCLVFFTTLTIIGIILFLIIAAL